jgi:hypothetical protein
VPAIEALGNLLENNSSLLMLNLSENRLGDEGVELLSKAFNEGKVNDEAVSILNWSYSLGFQNSFYCIKIELTLDLSLNRWE